MQYLLTLMILSGASLWSNQALSPESIGSTFGCNQSIYFVAPTESLFSPGDDVYVKVIVSDPNYVSYVDLYIGKQLVGRDHTHPYEWARPNATGHEELRNMPAGHYSITAVIKDVCGKKKTRSRKFTVGSPYLAVNKLPDHLTLIKKIRAQHNACKIAEYTKGRTSVFKVQSCRNSLYNYWYDRTGKLIGKFRARARYQGAWSTARFKKVLSDSCPGTIGLLE